MCKKFLSWKGKDETYIFHRSFSYLSCQIKWYEHKSLLTYSVDVHWLLAKGVLLDSLIIICTIFFYHYFLYLYNLDLWIITPKQRKLEMGIIKQANQMPFTHITYIIYIREGIGITPLRTNISILHSQRKTLINAEKSHTWKLLLKKFSSGFLLHRYRNII